MFSRPSNIVLLQRQDHQHMEKLLSSYEAGTAASRSQTYESIVDLVTTHAFAEETVLFPAARRLLPESDALTSSIEQKHQRVNELMVELQASKPGDPGFEQRAAALFSPLRTDAREEEDLLLPALARATDEAHLRAIGLAWATARRTAPNRPHPRVSRRPPGNVLAGLPLAISDRLRKVVQRLRQRAA